MDLELFKYSAEALKEISIDAQYNGESRQLIIDENNCEHRNGIVFFKQPLFTKKGKLSHGNLDRIAITKDININAYSYTFVLAVSESENDNDSLLNFYDIHDLGKFKCICSWGFPTGWNKRIQTLREVCDE